MLLQDISWQWSCGKAIWRCSFFAKVSARKACGQFQSGLYQNLGIVRCQSNLKRQFLCQDFSMASLQAVSVRTPPKPQNCESMASPHHEKQPQKKFLHAQVYYWRKLRIMKHIQTKTKWVLRHCRRFYFFCLTLSTTHLFRTNILVFQDKDEEVQNTHPRISALQCDDRKKKKKKKSHHFHPPCNILIKQYFISWDLRQLVSVSTTFNKRILNIAENLTKWCR